MKYLFERVVAYIVFVPAGIELITDGMTNIAVVFILLGALRHTLIDLKIHIDNTFAKGAS